MENGIKKDFSEFYEQKHIVTGSDELHFNSRLKMKDLAGLVSEEKKYVTWIFFDCYGFFGGETLRNPAEMPEGVAPMRIQKLI